MQLSLRQFTSSYIWFYFRGPKIAIEVYSIQNSALNISSKADPSTRTTVPARFSPINCVISIEDVVLFPRSTRAEGYIYEGETILRKPNTQTKPTIFFHIGTSSSLYANFSPLNLRQSAWTPSSIIMPNAKDWK